MEEVGAEIRRLREVRGWTGAQLAVYSDMAPSAISQIETGRRSPNTSSLAKIAGALGVEVVDLFPKKAQASLPLDSLVDGAGADEERRLTYLDAWKIFIRRLVRRWKEKPPESWAEIAPLYEALIAVLQQGVFAPYEHIGPAEAKTLETFMDLLENLNEIAAMVARGGEGGATVGNFQEALERRKQKAS